MSYLFFCNSEISLQNSENRFSNLILRIQLPKKHQNQNHSCLISWKYGWLWLDCFLLSTQRNKKYRLNTWNFSESIRYQFDVTIKALTSLDHRTPSGQMKNVFHQQDELCHWLFCSSWSLWEKFNLSEYHVLRSCYLRKTKNKVELDHLAGLGQLWTTCYILLLVPHNVSHWKGYMVFVFDKNHRGLLMSIQNQVTQKELYDRHLHPFYRASGTTVQHHLVGRVIIKSDRGERFSLYIYI